MLVKYLHLKDNYFEKNKTLPNVLNSKILNVLFQTSRQNDSAVGIASE